MTQTGGAVDAAAEDKVFAKAAARLLPLLFVCYLAAYLDRVNVGFAKLQMAGDLQLGDAAYGFGAGIFFIGYFLFEAPSNLILVRVGPKAWISRIMASWALVSAAFAFVGEMHFGGLAAAFGLKDAEFGFYVLRFLLGVAEAGFFPGVILYLTYWFPARRRSRMVAAFMIAIAVSNVVGGPISGAILEYMNGFAGLAGWRWLFLLEALPSLAAAAAILALLPDGPEHARWLSQDERALVRARLAEDEPGRHTKLVAAFSDWRLWTLCVVYFSHNVCIYAVSFWMPTIIDDFGVRKGDYLLVGLLTAIPWGLAAIAQIFWSARSDRTGERRWHAVAGLALACAGLLLLAAFPANAVAAMAALSCVTVGISCYVVVFWSLPTSMLSGAAAAAGIAWINAVGNLGGYVGPDLVGRVRAANAGAAGPAFLVLAGFALLAALIVARLPLAARRAASAAKPVA